MSYTYIVAGVGLLSVSYLSYRYVMSRLGDYWTRRCAYKTISKHWSRYMKSKRYRRNRLDIDKLPNHVPPTLYHKPAITIIGESEVADYMRYKMKAWNFKVHQRAPTDTTPITSDYVIAFDDCSHIPMDEEVCKVVYIVSPETRLTLGLQKYMLIHPATLYGKVHDSSLSELYQRVLAKPDVITYTNKMYTLLHIDSLCEIAYACMKSQFINVRVDACEPTPVSELALYEQLLAVTEHKARLEPEVNYPSDLKSRRVRLPDLRTLHEIIIPESKGLYTGLKAGLAPEKTKRRMLNTHLSQPYGSSPTRKAVE